MGRICKDRGRSTLAGIKERDGYDLPRRFLPKLLADVVSLLNRFPRGDQAESPLELFYPRCVQLVPRRDLRAAFEEILLF